VVELLRLAVRVTEYQMIVRRCPACGKRTRADLPPGGVAPAVLTPVETGPWWQLCWVPSTVAGGVGPLVRGSMAPPSTAEGRMGYAVCETRENGAGYK